jgi:H+/Cl- antiporter ClcA
VLFVIEEVIGRWTAGILGSVVLSAVSSVVVMRWFLGSESLFRIPVVQLQRPSELIAYSVLGVVGGRGVGGVLDWALRRCVRGARHYRSGRNIFSRRWRDC